MTRIRYKLEGHSLKSNLVLVNNGYLYYGLINREGFRWAIVAETTGSIVTMGQANSLAGAKKELKFEFKQMGAAFGSEIRNRKSANTPESDTETREPVTPEEASVNAALAAIAEF